MNLLDSITHNFFRSLFHSAKGNPLILYYWDTGTLLNENFLMLKKLLFLHHIISLPDTAVAKEIYLIQREKGYPGLALETDVFLQKLGIDSDPSCFSKAAWKKEVLTKIHRKNKLDLISQMKLYKKT